MDPTALLAALVGLLALVTAALVVLVVVLVRNGGMGGRSRRRPSPQRATQRGPHRPTPGPVPVAQVTPAQEEELRLRRQAVDRREELLAEREDRLNRYLEEVHNREAHLDQIAAGLDEREAQLEEAEGQRAEALAAVAGLSADAARAELMAHVEKDARLHAAQLTREIESEARRGHQQPGSRGDLALPSRHRIDCAIH